MTTINVINNTPRIKEAIKKCIKLLDEQKRDDDGYDEENETFQSLLDETYLSLDSLKLVKNFLNKHSEGKVYIHELLTSNNLYLPKYEQPQRSPELEERIQYIKAQAQEMEYQDMVKNVDLSSSYHTNRSGKARFVPEFKTAQGQLVSILNVVLVVGGAFAFGYKAVEYSLDSPDIVKQMLGGLILALIVAVADLYFLIKKLLVLDQPKKSKHGNISINSIRQEFKADNKSKTKSEKLKKND